MQPPRPTFSDRYIWLWLPPLLAVLGLALLFAWQMPTVRQVTLPLADSDDWAEGLRVLEQDNDGHLFRWTRPEASLTLPALGSISRKQLWLRLQTGRTDATPMLVTVQSDAHPMIFAVAAQPRQYAFLINDSFSAQPATISLSAPPYQTDGDRRTLGVVLSGVTVRMLEAGIPWWSVTLLVIIAQLGLLQLLLWRSVLAMRVRGLLLALWVLLQLAWLLPLGADRFDRFGVTLALAVSVAMPFGWALIWLCIWLVGWLWRTFIPWLGRCWQRSGYGYAGMAFSRWQRSDYVLATVLALLVLLVRLPLLTQAIRWLGADDYLVGLFAIGILRGDHALYFGQTGTLAAYLVAPLFAGLGISATTLVMLPLALTMVLVVALYGLGRDLAGRWGGLAAALWLVLPSTMAMQWTLKPQPGYLEVLALGSLMLWATVRLMWGPPLKRRTSGILMLAIGLCVGLAAWASLLVVSIGLTCALVVVLAWRRLASLPWWGYAGMILLPLLIWLLPLLWYMQERTDNALSWTIRKSRVRSNWLDSVEALMADILPELLGFAELTGRAPVATWLAVALTATALAALLLTLYEALIHRHLGAWIPLLLAAITIALFVLSKLSVIMRYVLPLYLALPLMAGFAVSRIARLRAGKYWASLTLILLLLLHSASVLGQFHVGSFEQLRTQAQIAQALQQRDIAYAYMTYWTGVKVLVESGGHVTTSSFVGPQRVTYDQANQTRVLQANGQRTAFVFHEEGVAAPFFAAYLKRHQITCQRDVVARYALYYDCHPFPNVYQLATMLPRGKE